MTSNEYSNPVEMTFSDKIKGSSTAGISCSPNHVEMTAYSNKIKDSTAGKGASDENPCTSKNKASTAELPSLDELVKTDKLASNELVGSPTDRRVCDSTNLFNEDCLFQLPAIRNQ